MNQPMGMGRALFSRPCAKALFPFVCTAKKLNGEFALVRLKRARQWLLIKKNDEFASKRDVTRDDRSVISGKRLADSKSPSSRRGRD